MRPYRRGLAGSRRGALGGYSLSGGGADVYLPTLTSGAAYVYAGGFRRMVDGYTGNLAKLYCATGTPSTLLIIAQDANGNADMSGVATWSGGSTNIEVDGWYNQLTGNYTASPSGNRPVYKVESTLNGNVLADTGWASNGTTLNFVQGLPSEAFTANRNNMASFAVHRYNGMPENTSRVITVNDGATVTQMALNHTRYNLNGGVSPATLDTELFAPVNKLSVSGFSSNGTNLTFHQNDQSYNGSAQSSAAVATTWFGMSSTVSTQWGRCSLAGGVTIAPNPDASEIAAIKAALYDIWTVKRSTTHRMTVIPHSLAMEYNTLGRNRSTWFYLNALLNKDVHINVVAENGRTLAAQMTTNVADVTACYDAAATTHTLFMLNAVNDIQNLSSGFAGGNAGLITAAATTLYNTYITAKNVWTALGANAKVIIGTGWQPISTFWSGTAQDILDKAQVMVEWNALIIANATAEGYKVADDATIDLTSALADTVHTNPVGAARRAAKDAIPINEIIA